MIRISNKLQQIGYNKQECTAILQAYAPAVEMYINDYYLNKTCWSPEEFAEEIKIINQMND